MVEAIRCVISYIFGSSPLHVMYPGDVMHLKVLNQNIIILNSVKAASELLDKRGALYSDRPRFIVFEMYVSLFQFAPFNE